ncbi:MAG: 4-(cytidine 5'-diphospho)-2-C-methyl-D-erythritol kinase [Gemmatimonadetes bacterium]|nr:4-(cytidine 5'-diphospho)-2-C-methyl-D-erythritol kinase [Gemmatimonadota bacterium]
MPCSTVRILAPAKINLWLRVHDRRPDGFHDLDTLFQAVDLCDEVEVTRRAAGGVALSVEGADLGPEEENLAHRAARGFLHALGPAAGSDGVAIRLRKRIPAGAGLGGGASDAAAVLRCLDVLWGHPVSSGTLAEIGARLGSDVPFFLGEHPLARGRGRGEVLEGLSPLPEATLVLVLPPVHVATGPAYAALARYRGEHGPGASAAAPEAFPTGWHELRRTAANDFELVVPVAHPEGGASLEALRRAGARPALLSGSGAACFGVLPDGTRARAAAERLTAELGWPAVSARTLTAFPAPRPV